MKTFDVKSFCERPEVRQLFNNDGIIPEKRRLYSPQISPALRSAAAVEEIKDTGLRLHPEAARNLPKISKNTPLRLKAADAATQAFKKARKIGVVFSGGPAPGGHNVIAGLYDAAKKANPDSKIFGFLAGPGGVMKGKYLELTSQIVHQYRNMGGFTMIKTGRDKIDTPDKMEQCKKTCASLGLDALVVVGGDDSNTNAAFIAEAAHDKGVQVIGVPKTIDGDMQVPGYCQISFGFHSAARAYANVIGNLCTDSSSDVKYWHFVKIMGRSASHLAMEAAFLAHPNIVLIGEEIADKGMTIHDIVKSICDIIVKRSEQGKNYGVVVMPEGLLECIDDINVIIIKLNKIIADYNEGAAKEGGSFYKDFADMPDKMRYVNTQSIWRDHDSRVLLDLPEELQEGLFQPRDSHGNFPFSQVQTDEIILDMVKTYLVRLKNDGVYKGKFSAQPLFAGYFGRGTLPTKFDCDYGYNLGSTAFALIASGVTGYMAAVQDLHLPVSEWKPVGVPIASLLHLEERKGKLQLVIEKALVDLEAPAFKILMEERAKWTLEDNYRVPGPIQFEGDNMAVDSKPMIMLLNEMGRQF
ncbi:MAG: diphosphate--fructose-6-phosphate 1-phosphotransferase [Pseudomonadota bacterium]